MKFPPPHHKVHSQINALGLTATKSLEILEWVANEIEERCLKSTSIKAKEALASLAQALSDKVQREYDP